MGNTQKEVSIICNSSKKKSGNYIDYRIIIPSSIVEQFCLKEKQKLIITSDYLKRKITLRVNDLDLPTHNEWAQRIFEKGEKSTKKKKKIKNSEEIILLRHIDSLKKRITTLSLPKEVRKRNLTHDLKILLEKQNRLKEIRIS